MCVFGSSLLLFLRVIAMLTYVNRFCIYKYEVYMLAVMPRVICVHKKLHLPGAIEAQIM